MIRLYGRSIRGQRCFDTAPHKWKTITMLSSIRSDGHTEAIVFQGALNMDIMDIFDAYIEKVLAPSLRPGDIVVMDNFNFWAWCVKILESLSNSVSYLSGAGSYGEGESLSSPFFRIEIKDGCFLFLTY